MRVTAIMAMLAITGMAATDELSDSRVMAAIQHVWLQSKGGLLGQEAGFRLDGNRSSYHVVPLSVTNEYLTLSVSIIQGVTFALFHVHPTQLDPRPSKRDIAIADQYKVKVFTIHAKGIFMYDPASGTTVKLRNYLEWVKLAQIP